MFFINTKSKPVLSANYNVVEAVDVRNFLTSQFYDAEIKASANIKGSILYKLIEILETRPFFYYNPSESARFTFSSWYGVLDLRENTYNKTNKPILRDLYLLHELNHMATLHYAKMTDQEWKVEHIRNEKASSVWSEALVYFEYPGLFSKIQGVFPLWVEPFVTEKIQFIPGISNAELYAKSPMVLSALLFQEFSRISEKEYSTLSAIEKRTRTYDYLTEAWCDGNVVIQKEVNDHHVTYFQKLHEARLENNIDLRTIKMREAIEFHRHWLVVNTSPSRILFNKTHKLRDSIKQEDVMHAAKGDQRFTTLELHDKIPFSFTMQGFLNQTVVKMGADEKDGLITRTPLVEPTKKLIQHAGITTTIYSLFTKPAMITTHELWGKPNIQNELYGSAQTRQQDKLNIKYAAGYKEWVQGLICGLDDFPFAYPTNGSSEALRESMVDLAAKAKAAGNPNIKLHVFQSEYEGAKNYAEGSGILVAEHPVRSLEALNKSNALKVGDLFYISYPSGIDGNRWEALPKFLDLMHSKGVRVLLDLTYVGTYKSQPNEKVIVNHPAVECVYFSFSKAFGVYYHRIGGMFSRRENSLLFGNKWFKNMFSMTLGIELMKNYSPNDIPTTYKNIQEVLTMLVNSKLGLQLQPSDVFLIAHQNITKEQFSTLSPELKILCRPVENGEKFVLRVCLQPMMDYLTNEFSRTFPVFNLDAKPAQSVNLTTSVLRSRL